MFCGRRGFEQVKIDQSETNVVRFDFIYGYLYFILLILLIWMWLYEKNSDNLLEGLTTSIVVRPD